MKYNHSKELLKDIKEDQTYSQFIEKSRREVDEFFKEFNDSPDRTSRWGHHYFCKEDGGLLIYDDQKPSEHVCSICGASYTNDLLNGVWVYMYRNQGVVNAWKSAMIYKMTGEKDYLNNVLEYSKFYSDNYLNFKLHNKEGNEFESIEDMAWGCSRIMPQALNESIFIIRLINALEIVKADLSGAFIDELESNLFGPAFEMFKPQVDKIHNISCWLNSAIGVMGLFLSNDEMKSFTFDGAFNINDQLIKGVTEDFFWYEGSIHYNFFTLEGIVNLLLFSKVYDYDFSVGKDIVEKMLINAYKYAFDSHQLPNPNDGWPNVNLKSYSYIYAAATKVYGIESTIGKLYVNILKKEGQRNEFPLSKPYYFDNDVSLEELLFTPFVRNTDSELIKYQSINFPTSYCGTIKNERVNVFYKYGHNGPSHAHPDKMTIEVVVDNESLSRDLSNSGYGNALCNEWHRVSASHNTVVINGENHTSVEGGQCIESSKDHVVVTSKGVYENIDFKRSLELSQVGFKDQFEVNMESDNTADYFFHVEGRLNTILKTEEASLGYDKNGYQHLKDIKKVITDQTTIELEWLVSEKVITSSIDISKCEFFIAKSPDNPVTGYRTTLILRRKVANPTFKVEWRIKGD